MTAPTLPRVSVVIETITARFDASTGSLVRDLEAALNALETQTYPREQFEVLVVVDAGVPESTTAELQQRWPSLILTSASESNYFAAKNAGAARASGEIVTLLDGDCVPERDWLEVLVARFDDAGVVAVAGRTRYAGSSATARTFSIPDFLYIGGDDSGAATGFNLNNLAMRREVLLAHPLDARIRRNGGCYFLFHQLRQSGARILYEPRAFVQHEMDGGGTAGLVRKHFQRGFDSIGVYRLDEQNVLRGTPVIRRFGAAGLAAIVARRIVVDWIRLARKHRQIGIPAITVPYFAAVGASMRLVELAGGITAMVDPHRYEGV